MKEHKGGGTAAGKRVGCSCRRGLKREGRESDLEVTKRRTGSSVGSPGKAGGRTGSSMP